MIDSIMGDSLQMLVGAVIMVAGTVFCIIGAVGLLRLPDVFARMHAASLVDTLGMLLLILGMMVIEGFTQNTAKLLIIAIFILLTAPVATHALSRTTLKEGVKPRLADEADDSPGGSSGGRQ